jgi:hypothetical protein
MIRARFWGTGWHGDGMGGDAVGRALLVGEAERFGMVPAVVLIQRLAEGAGPVGHGTLTDFAAGDRKLGNVTGNGEKMTYSFASMVSAAAQ